MRINTNYAQGQKQSSNFKGAFVVPNKELDFMVKVNPDLSKGARAIIRGAQNTVFGFVNPRAELSVLHDLTEGNIILTSYGKPGMQYRYHPRANGMDDFVKLADEK